MNYKTFNKFVREYEKLIKKLVRADEQYRKKPTKYRKGKLEEIINKITPLALALDSIDQDTLTKKCNKCKQELPLDNFSNRKQKTTKGKQSSCKQCNKEYVKSHPLSYVYHAMVHRCYNETDKGYKYYGAKGVIVCDRWLGNDGKKNFIEDMEPTWEEGLHLDKDILSEELGIYPPIYSPETCQWVTRKENNKHRKFSKKTKEDGE